MTTKTAKQQTLEVVHDAEVEIKTDDPWNLEALSADDDYLTASADDDITTNVEVIKKLNPMTYFRVHPDPAYQGKFYIVVDSDKVGGEHYLVPPLILGKVPEIAEIAKKRQLNLVVTSDGTPYLMVTGLPDDELGLDDAWNKSKRGVIEHAKREWVRMVRQGKQYAVRTAKTAQGEPRWPKESFQELMKLAFARNFIDSPEHPFIQALHEVNTKS